MTGRISVQDEEALSRVWPVLRRETDDLSAHLPDGWSLDFRVLGSESGLLLVYFSGREIMLIERDVEFREWRVSSKLKEVSGRESRVAAMLVRAADALVAERSVNSPDLEILAALDALLPADSEDELIWMAGPPEGVLQDAFTAGPFARRHAAVYPFGHVLVGRTPDGRIVQAFRRREDDVFADVEIPVEDLADALAEMSSGRDGSPAP
jgi:hypothetical protein